VRAGLERTRAEWVRKHLDRAEPTVAGIHGECERDIGMRRARRSAFEPGPCLHRRRAAIDAAALAQPLPSPLEVHDTSVGRNSR
jgi:hypothetical protein